VRISQFGNTENSARSAHRFTHELAASFQLALVGDDFARDARFGTADDFDPASGRDDADNQPENQVRKGALSKQHEHATNHCSKVSQSVIFGEHPTGADAPRRADAFARE
jgi:hypothetical protein